MYMESICRAGKTKIVWKYHCYHAGKPGEKRKKKANKTKESQQKVNDRQTERRLTGILNENFDGSSWYVTWSYREDLRPKDIEELKLQISQLLRDLRKLYKKEGLVLKYVWTGRSGKAWSCPYSHGTFWDRCQKAERDMEIWLCDHETDGSIRTVQQTGKLFSEILPENS